METALPKSIFQIPFSVTESTKTDKLIVRDLLKEIYDEDDIEFLTLAFERMVKKSIEPLLLCDPKDLPRCYMECFRIALPCLLLFTPKGDYGKVLKVTIDLYDVLKAEVPDDLLDAFEILCETEIWYLTRISEMGLEGFVNIIAERATEEFNWLVNYYLSTAFLFFACYLAKKDLVNYKPETLSLLISWLKSYSSELDSYLSTADLLVTDEYYEVIKNYMQD